MPRSKGHNDWFAICEASRLMVPHVRRTVTTIKGHASSVSDSLILGAINILSVGARRTLPLIIRGPYFILMRDEFLEKHICFELPL